MRVDAGIKSNETVSFSAWRWLAVVAAAHVIVLQSLALQHINTMLVARNTPLMTTKSIAVTMKTNGDLNGALSTHPRVFVTCLSSLSQTTVKRLNIAIGLTTDRRRQVKSDTHVLNRWL